jgi:hypothetical protein
MRDNLGFIELDGQHLTFAVGLDTQHISAVTK